MMARVVALKEQKVLEQTLWEAADQLRGNQKPSEYKHLERCAAALAIRHYRKVVEDVITKLNAESQNKVSCRDVGETDLSDQAFSERPPVAGKPRLHCIA